MEQCRACLALDKQTLPMDENFINNYNILTSLDAKLTDGMSHSICEECVQTVNSFMDFREKCISSESTLKSVRVFKCEIIEENIQMANEKYTDKDIKIEYGFDQCQDNVIEASDSSEAMTNDNNKVKNHRKNFRKSKENKSSSQHLSDLKLEKRHRRNLKKLTEVHQSPNVKNRSHKKPPNQLLSCGLCPKEFVNKQLLSDHLESHKPDRQCNICSKTLKDWPQFVTHRIEHVPRNQIFCHICYMRFISPTTIEFHYRRTHYDEEFKPECHLCKHKFSTPCRLRKHVYLMHSNKMHICDYCSKVYFVRQGFISHIRSHTDFKSYNCDVCDFSCKFSSNLKDHKIRKHAVQKFACKKCKRVFAAQMDLDKHSCHQEHGMVCPVCGKNLGRKDGLARHMRVHDAGVAHACPRCPQVFKRKETLLVHVNRHDGNRTKQCEYCPAKFYSGSVLIKHRRIHTGEKPYVCKICEKGFTANHNLKVHMKVHGEYLVHKKES